MLEVRRDGNCPDSYTLTRTWTATDNCGNKDVQTQQVNGTDDIPPLLTGVPADITVDCNNLPDVPQIGTTITASDNCGANVEITFVESRSDVSCTNNFVLTRTWVATDNCGNETAQTQSIQVQDEEAPVLNGVPGDIEVSCESVPAPAQPTATDNCDSNVDIRMLC